MLSFESGILAKKIAISSLPNRPGSLSKSSLFSTALINAGNLGTKTLLSTPNLDNARGKAAVTSANPPVF